ncbi:MAG: hypothetical protein KAS23_14475 [Anaerohalosphaera sp.]|nr:hypothetical protein [Anaerohalosphaera sp.]
MVDLPDRNEIALKDRSFCPDLLTEDELIVFLRIPEVSNAKDYHNVIEHLKRFRDLPRIHICNKALYPKEAIRKWIEEKTIMGK